MMRQLTLIILFTLIFTSNIYAQVEKGGYFLGLSSTNAWRLNYRNYKENYKGISAITFQKMVSNRWMIGTGIRYLDDNLGIVIFGSRNSFPYYVVEIPLNVRYYITNQKLASYAWINQNAGYFEVNNSSRLSPNLNVVNDHKFNYQAFTGLGLDYFLSENVVLNAETGTTIFSTGDFYGDNRKFFFEVGLDLYFNRKGETKIEDLTARVLKKGNIGLSGDIVLNLDYEEKEMNLIRIAPSGFYHLTDKWVVGADLLYVNRNILAPTDGKTGAIGLQTGYYVSLGKDLFLNPVVGGRFSRTVQENLSDLYGNNVTLFGGLYLTYFKNNFRFNLGPQFDYQRSKFTGNSDFIRLLNLSMQTKVDYFLNKNIYFISVLELKIADRVFYNDNSFDLFGSGYQLFNLNFGMGFLL